MDITVDLSDTILETERLKLRPWKESDLADFYEYASVDGVGEAAGWTHHKSQEESKRILDMFIEENNTLAVVYRENGKVIGSIGLHNSWANGEPNYRDIKIKEVGYVLSRDYWAHGLMPEAVKCFIKYCFESTPLEALSCGHFNTNTRSGRVIEKCGFTLVSESDYYSAQTECTYPSKKYILMKK